LITRRRLLATAVGGAGVIVAGGAAAAELAAHGVLPGRSLVDAIDGACAVTPTTLRFGRTGPSVSGRFYSRARRCSVGYTIAYPPDHGSGDALPLIVMLHGFGANHTNAVAGMSPTQALALRIDGDPLPPMAMVTVDGGGGYWNPHPRDDPMSMVIDELIPLCQSRGLGSPPHRVATMGISMGGYGAILFAEKAPELFAAVAAISPAIWTSYAQARAVNAGAYASAAAFAANDAVTHTATLAGKPVRVASGNSDPFHPAVEKLVRALPPGAVVDFSNGCHTGAFFTSQEPPSLTFLARHLT
jgi:S-formylglutathione hydrolase FrmB